jgi:hypothetical protein
MKRKTFHIVNGDISDGYHTFDELYDHRCLLFINLCLATPEKSAWKKDYEDWFCLYLETDRGQISYHCPQKYLRLIESTIKHDPEYEWDGHTSADVLKRLGN